MTSKAPQIYLTKDFVRPLKDGQAELHLTCRVDAEELKGITLRVTHSDEVQNILYEGPVDESGAVSIKAVLSQIEAHRGRIFASFVGSTDTHSTKKTHPTPSGDWSSIGAFTKAPAAPKSTSEPPQTPNKSLRRTPQGRQMVPTPSPAPSRGLRRQGRAETKQPQIPSKRKALFPDIKRTLTRAAPYLAFGATLVAGALEFIREGYEQGVIDAAEVTRDARLIPQIPVKAVQDDGDFQTLTYLPTKPFIGSHIETWNSESKAHPIGMDTPQSENMEFLIRPISTLDVQKGGSLYLTRQALVFAEQRNFEDGTGLNVAGLVRAVLSFGAQGGSTIGDQVCGAVWEQTGKFPSLEQIKNADPVVGSAIANKLNKLDRKKHEVFCSLGLGYGEQMDVDEVITTYLNFAPLGNSAIGALNFMSIFWGIDDVNDPALTRGKKLVLAALSKQPLPSPLTAKHEQFDEIWDKKVVRATWILNGLIESGIIEESDRATILQEINDAKPNAKVYALGIQRKTKKNTDAYDFPRVFVSSEFKQHLQDSGLDFEEWRATHDGLITAIDPQLQESLPEIVKKGVATLPSNVFGTVLVVNERGEMQAIYTGDKKGPDEQMTARRTTQLEYPGSTGKLFVGAGLGEMGHHPSDGNPKISRAAHDLKVSSPDLIPAAVALGVDSKHVKERIECYGAWRAQTSLSPIAAAVEGNWDVPMINVPAYLYAMLTGKDLNKPHILVGDSNQTTVQEWTASPSTRPENCATLMYANGLAMEWGHLPFQRGGTMEELTMPASVKKAIGKTGTANSVEASNQHGTNVVWAPFAIENKDGSHFMVVTLIRPEKSELTINKKTGKTIIREDRDVHSNMGNWVFADKVAVPMSKAVLDSLLTTKK